MQSPQMHTSPQAPQVPGKLPDCSTQGTCDVVTRWGCDMFLPKLLMQLKCSTKNNPFYSAWSEYMHGVFVFGDRRPNKLIHRFNVIPIRTSEGFDWG